MTERAKLKRLVLLLREDEFQAVRDCAHETRKSRSDVVRGVIRTRYQLEEDPAPVQWGGTRKEQGE